MCSPNVIHLSAVLAIVVIVGCGGAADVDDQAGRMVYVDTDTMQPLVHEIFSELPAVHPATGKRTLMPALYCPKCEQWRAVPPPDQINRMAGAAKCPKTGAALIADGPWPDELVVSVK